MPIVAQSVNASGSSHQQTTKSGLFASGLNLSSTEAAVQQGKNSFQSQGGVSTADIQNTAGYSANSHGVSLGFGNGKPSGSAGVDSDSGNARSTTQAGISGVAGHQEARTGDTEAGLKPIFDKNKVKTEVQDQVTVTTAFVQESRTALNNHTQQQRDRLKQQAQNAVTAEERDAVLAQLASVNRQEQVLNILISAVTGTGGNALLQEGLSYASDQMRELMIDDSRKFAGVVDSSGKTLDNISGESEGVAGDGIKLGGTRVDLDGLCGVANERCAFERNADGSIDTTKPVVFLGSEIQNADGSTRRQNLDDFLATPEGKKLIGPTGGVQGMKGTLFGIPYAAGSWQDKLIEAFAGPHDYIGGSASGLYDEQGNAKRGMSRAESNAYGVWSGVAIPIAAPFAAASAIPPDVWQAISLLLKTGR